MRWWLGSEKPTREIPYKHIKLVETKNKSRNREENRKFKEAGGYHLAANLT